MYKPGQCSEWNMLECGGGGRRRVQAKTTSSNYVLNAKDKAILKKERKLATLTTTHRVVYIKADHTSETPESVSHWESTQNLLIYFAPRKQWSRAKPMLDGTIKITKANTPDCKGTTTTFAFGGHGNGDPVVVHGRHLRGTDTEDAEE